MALTPGAASHRAGRLTERGYITHRSTTTRNGGSRKSPRAPVIDFGDRAMLVARQVAWAPDGKSIYAAVADINADIVLLDGLI